MTDKTEGKIPEVIEGLKEIQNSCYTLKNTPRKGFTTYCVGGESSIQKNYSQIFDTAISCLGEYAKLLEERKKAIEELPKRKTLKGAGGITIARGSNNYLAGENDMLDQITPLYAKLLEERKKVGEEWEKEIAKALYDSVEKTSYAFTSNRHMCDARDKIKEQLIPLFAKKIGEIEELKSQLSNYKFITQFTPEECRYLESNQKKLEQENQALKQQEKVWKQQLEELEKYISNLGSEAFRYKNVYKMERKKREQLQSQNAELRKRIEKLETKSCIEQQFEDESRAEMDEPDNPDGRRLDGAKEK